MIKKIFICAFLLSFILFDVQITAAKTRHDVLGIENGMKRADALRRLQKLGKLEKEESKQQEVWSLTNEPHYSYVIIGFNKEKTKVRFITAKAREKGVRVRYADVLDIKKAQKTGADGNYKYELKMPSRRKAPGYLVIARGTDAVYLTYFSIKQLENDEDEID
jgi:hypothetical protein